MFCPVYSTALECLATAAMSCTPWTWTIRACLRSGQGRHDVSCVGRMPRRRFCPHGASGVKVRAPMARLTYLDHAATTPLAGGVVEAMAPHRRERRGNPTRLYSPGRVARRALDESRDTVAQVLRC